MTHNLLPDLKLAEMMDSDLTKSDYSNQKSVFPTIRLCSKDQIMSGGFNLVKQVPKAKSPTLPKTDFY